MALTKTITLTGAFEKPVTFSDAYIKVDEVTVTKAESAIVVGFYEAQDGLHLRSEKHFAQLSCADDAPNAIKQAYEHIKALPDFADAANC